MSSDRLKIFWWVVLVGIKDLVDPFIVDDVIVGIYPALKGCYLCSFSLSSWRLVCRMRVNHDVSMRLQNITKVFFVFMVLFVVLLVWVYLSAYYFLFIFLFASVILIVLPLSFYVYYLKFLEKPIAAVPYDGVVSVYYPMGLVKFYSRRCEFLREYYFDGSLHGMVVRWVHQIALSMLFLALMLTAGHILVVYFLWSWGLNDYLMFIAVFVLTAVPVLFYFDADLKFSALRIPHIRSNSGEFPLILVRGFKMILKVYFRDTIVLEEPLGKALFRDVLGISMNENLIFVWGSKNILLDRRLNTKRRISGLGIVIDAVVWGEKILTISIVREGLKFRTLIIEYDPNSNKKRIIKTAVIPQKFVASRDRIHIITREGRKINLTESITI